MLFGDKIQVCILPAHTRVISSKPVLSRMASRIGSEPSILEMWNLIESVGIKREMVDKVLTPEEVVTELYRFVERRLHYEREQEMIKQLRTHVGKLKGEGFLRTLEKASSMA